jgi:hypothetical protein
MEQEMFARAGLFSLEHTIDPAYVLGLKESISIALEYGIECIENSEGTMPPVPTALYAQARLAARNGVKAGDVIGRYISGFHLIQMHMEEVIESEQLVGTKALKEIRRVSSLVIDQLVAEISEQHDDETHKQAASPEATRIRLVRKQLAGEPIDASQLSYDFDGFHVGVAANGPGAAIAIKGLAKAMDCVELTVEPTDASVWAWLGRRTPPDIDRIEKLVSQHWPAADAIAIGEIGQGLGGWRLTYHQAISGVLVSMRRGGFFRYRDDPILATLLGDPVLAESFQQMYLAPLSAERDGGMKLRRTLYAYCAAERNGASAAEVLKVSRQTVNNHLKMIENRIGRPLCHCIADVEAALRLAAIESTNCIRNDD